MATLDETRAARGVLKDRLGRPSWLRGVGVGQDSGRYVILVNVAKLTAEVRAAVPDSVQGVPVVVRTVGDITTR